MKVIMAVLCFIYFVELLPKVPDVFKGILSFVVAFHREGWDITVENKDFPKW